MARNNLNGKLSWATVVTPNASGAFPPTRPTFPGTNVLNNAVQDLPAFTSTQDPIEATPIFAPTTSYVPGRADTGGSVELVVFVGNPELALLEPLRLAARGAGNDEENLIAFEIEFTGLDYVFYFEAYIGLMSTTAVGAAGALTTTISLTPAYVAGWAVSKTQG